MRRAQRAVGVDPAPQDRMGQLETTRLSALMSLRTVVDTDRAAQGQQRAVAGVAARRQQGQQGRPPPPVERVELPVAVQHSLLQRRSAGVVEAERARMVVMLFMAGAGVAKAEIPQLINHLPAGVAVFSDRAGVVEAELGELIIFILRQGQEALMAFLLQVLEVQRAEMAAQLVQLAPHDLARESVVMEGAEAEQIALVQVETEAMVARQVEGAEAVEQEQQPVVQVVQEEEEK